MGDGYSKPIKRKKKEKNMFFPLGLKRSSCMGVQKRKLILNDSSLVLTDLLHNTATYGCNSIHKMDQQHTNSMTAYTSNFLLIILMDSKITSLDRCLQTGKRKLLTKDKETCNPNLFQTPIALAYPLGFRAALRGI